MNPASIDPPPDGIASYRPGFYLLKRDDREPAKLLWDGIHWWQDGETVMLSQKTRDQLYYLRPVPPRVRL